LHGVAELVAVPEGSAFGRVTPTRSRRQSVVWFGGSSAGLPGAVRVAVPSGTVASADRLSGRCADRTGMVRNVGRCARLRCGGNVAAMAWAGGGDVFGQRHANGGSRVFGSGFCRSLETFGSRRRGNGRFSERQVFGCEVPGSGRIQGPVAFGPGIQGPTLRGRKLETSGSRPELLRKGRLASQPSGRAVGSRNREFRLWIYSTMLLPEPRPWAK